MSEPVRTVVCFDLGGVLVRICQSWADACELAGLSRRELSPDAQRQRRTIAGRYESGELDCTKYHAALAQALDGAYTESELERIHAAWTREEYPGVFELVSALNAQSDVVTACLSNTNHAHWVRLSGADGRAEYPTVLALRHKLASHQLGCNKPDARIYELALERFSDSGHLAPARVIFFDDLADNVRAAQALGWQAFQIDPRGDTSSQLRAHLLGRGVRC